jgi:hypothetical protein
VAAHHHKGGAAVAGKGGKLDADAGAMIYIDDSRTRGTLPAPLGPGSGSGVCDAPSPPFLWWLLYYTDRMSTRQSLAWSTKPQWWASAFMLGAVAISCYVLRISFSTFTLCPQHDGKGGRFYDYCENA